jgi:hypothetical protein
MQVQKCEGRIGGINEEVAVFDSIFGIKLRIIAIRRLAIEYDEPTDKFSRAEGNQNADCSSKKPAHYQHTAVHVKTITIWHLLKEQKLMVCSECSKSKASNLKFVTS